MIYLIVILALAFISGSSKGLMDTLNFHFETSVCSKWGKFWDHNSWTNEYKAGTLIRKKILGINIPALFTNGWHLFQSIYLTLIFICMSLSTQIRFMNFGTIEEIIAIFILFRASFGAGFVLFYNYILVKK